MATIATSTNNPDVIVIGGGLIGSSVALRLAQAKLRVFVFDRGDPGAEASSAAAGMIGPQGETAEPDAFFALCAASQAMFPEFVAEVEDLTGRDVGFRRDGSLLVATDEKQVAKLEKLFWNQSRAGLPMERVPVASLEHEMPGLSPKIRLALGASEDYWVDNEKLTRAVIDAAHTLGVKFQTRCAVEELVVRGARVEAVQARTSPHEGAPSLFSAAWFVLTAGCWSGALAAQAGLQLSMRPCRGQMMEFESPREIPHVVRAGTHYLVPRSARRVVVGTTAEYAGFDKSVTAEGLQSILNGTLKFAPFLKGCVFLRCWAGLRPDTSDHLPIIGYSKLDNLIIATGHFRHGILLAPITAQQVSELVLKRAPSFPLEPYRPGRFA